MLRHTQPVAHGPFGSFRRIFRSGMIGADCPKQAAAVFPPFPCEYTSTQRDVLPGGQQITGRFYHVPAVVIPVHLHEPGIHLFTILHRLLQSGTGRFFGVVVMAFPGNIQCPGPGHYLPPTFQSPPAFCQRQGIEHIPRNALLFTYLLEGRWRCCRDLQP